MSIIDRIRKLLGGRSTADASDGADCPSTVAAAGGGSEMIPCEDALRLVHDFLDGELDGVPQAQVKAHFDVCQRCYPHLQLETAFRDALRRAGSGEGAPSELRAKVAALISEAETEG
jgi:mycothiol system anti-sigma-R factor